jgi:hypothetical protein
MITAKDALISLRPGAQWTWSGNEYFGLNWLDNEQEKPTIQEISSEIERLKQEELSKYYQQARASEYPPYTDYLDAVYWQIQGDNSKMDAYVAACTAVKEKYPKDMKVPSSVVQAINSISLLSGDVLDA